MQSQTNPRYTLSASEFLPLVPKVVATQQLSQSKDSDAPAFCEISGLDARLGLLPERFHFLQGGVGGLAAGFRQAPLDVAQAALVLVVGGAQRRFGIDLAMAREVGDGEQDVAQLVGQAGLVDVPGLQL